MILYIRVIYRFSILLLATILVVPLIMVSSSFLDGVLFLFQSVDESIPSLKLLRQTAYLYISTVKEYTCLYENVKSIAINESQDSLTVKHKILR